MSIKQSVTAPPEALVTKHGVQVALGQHWRNCDRRQRADDRERYVIGIDLQSQKVRLGATPDATRGTWTSVRRMYKHSTGWELVA